MDCYKTGISITKEQKEWLARNGIQLSPIVRSLMEELMNGDSHMTIAEVVKRAWKQK